MKRAFSQNLRSVIALAVGLSLWGVLLASPPAMAHGGGPMMKLSHSQMLPGDRVMIEAEGFEGTKSVEIVLKGTRGEIPLGKFMIPGEDFSLKVSMPQDLRPGPYELILRAGDKVAKERIRIMPSMTGRMGAGMGMGEMGPASGMMGRGMTSEGPTPTTTATTQEQPVATDEAQTSGSEPVPQTAPPTAQQIGTVGTSPAPSTNPSPAGQPAVAVERPGWLTLTVWVLVILLVGGGGYMMGLASKLTKTLEKN